MAFAKNTQVANRYGLNTKIYALTETAPGADAEPLMVIDFANVSALNVSSDRVWATGGQAHANQVPFENPMTGSVTLSTNMQTMELLALMAGDDLATFEGTSVDFANNKEAKFFTIVSETVWKSKDGTVYDEVLTFWKASAQRALNISYSGEGDPVSMDLVLDLTENDAHKVVTIERKDQAAAAG